MGLPRSPQQPRLCYPHVTVYRHRNPSTGAFSADLQLIVCLVLITALRIFQQIFRQLLGAPAMATYWQPSIPNQWQWQLLAPWIQSCPPENPPVEWSLFPELKVDNNPTLVRPGSKAAVSTNVTALINPGDTIYFSWEDAASRSVPTRLTLPSTVARSPLMLSGSPT